MPCPHCGSTCKTVKTHNISPVYRELIFSCRSPACMYVFKACMEPLCTLDPSVNPRPGVNIPDSRRARPT